MKQHNTTSAHDIVAWAIIELNVSLRYEVLCEMSPNDPLYIALVDAWKKREERLDRRTGLLAAVIANCMGSGQKKFEVSDFMPHEPKTEEQCIAELKAYMTQYEIYRQNGQLG